MSATLKKNDPKMAQQFFADKMAFTTGPVELSANLDEKNPNIVVIDVREAEDYRKGHIPGALNLPRDQWSSRAGLRKDKLNVLYCYSHVCHLAAAAAVEMSKDGYSIMEMDGGFEAWKENDLEISKDSPQAKGNAREPALA
jgi:rhodanese-related sulfurtransferase